METKIIYFVHGTTYDNVAERCSGWKRECNYGKYDGESKELVVYEEHIEEPFPEGESLKDVENRIKEFIQFIKNNYEGKTVAIMAHRAPQLALEVLTKNISWEEAIKNDWRKTKAWQPGWEYII